MPQRTIPLRLLVAGIVVVLAGLVVLLVRPGDDEQVDGAVATATTSVPGSAPDGPSTSTSAATRSDGAEVTATSGGANGGAGPSDASAPLEGALATVCDDDPGLCSNADGMRVAGGAIQTAALKAPDDVAGSRPTILIASEPRAADGSMAVVGGGVTSLNVVATVDNETGASVTMAAPPLALDVFRDGQHLATYTLSNGPSTLADGQQLTHTFTVPIDGDGTYVWQARTAYEA